MSRIVTIVLGGILSMVGIAPADAAVTGRYVYFANALSERMRVAEIEVYSGGVNVIAKRAESITRGMEAGLYRIDRSPEQILQARRMVVDGNTNTSAPGVDIASLYSVGGEIPLRNASFEVDLGRAMPIERIAFYMGRHTEKIAGDLGWRLIAVLDASRRVVAWKAFNIFGDEAKDKAGRWMFDITPTQGGLTGRKVEPGQACWFTEVDFLHECLGKPLPAASPQRTDSQLAQLKRFEQRNTPAEIQKLAERFFHIAVDLDHPSMAQVKPLVDQKKYIEAFEAFKRPFFQLLAPMKDWDGGWKSDNIYSMYGWPEDPDSLATLQAKDMLRGYQANLKTLTIQRIEPGLIPLSQPDHPMPSRPLLADYAVNKRLASLKLWEMMIDSWALEFQDAADRNPAALRDYFVLDTGQLPRTLRDFYHASVANPKLVDELSGMTLARLLLPMLEEIPVAAWRVERKSVFNHSFNSISASLWTSMYMPQFRAIQRQKQENIQGFVRLWTLASYRDGPMTEMGDEGHFSVQLGTPVNVYGILKHYQQDDWLTPAREKYFLDHIRKAAEFSIRHVSQTGTSWRSDASDHAGYIDHHLNIADPKWANLSHTTRMTWGETYPQTLLKIMQHPQIRAVIDTVYGRGHESYPLRNRIFTRNKIAGVYGGKYQGKPDFLSDYLPYAGLHYFRSGWDREDAYLHMMNPPIANNLAHTSYSLGSTPASVSILASPTGYRFVDYATPLLSTPGISIDGLPPAPHESRYPSGSKQNTFTQAVEKPQASRWYTGQDFDFGESTYRGNYRSVVRDTPGRNRTTSGNRALEVVENVTTTRQIFQIRPARLFLQIDRIRHADPAQSHTHQLINCVQLTEPDPKSTKQFSEKEQLLVSDHDKLIRTTCPDNAGLTLRFFGQPEATLAASDRPMRPFGQTITYSGYRGSAGRDVTTSWKAKGQTVLVTAIRAHKPGGNPILSARDVSTATVAGGVIVTEGNVQTTLLVARSHSSPLVVGQIRANAEALLVVEQPGQSLRGIILGAVDVTLSGKPMEAAVPDFHFTIQDGQVKATPIFKPIDPPTILPMVNTFIDQQEVTILSDTPNVEIFYTMDGSDPTTQSHRYTQPFIIHQDAFIQARAFRPGVSDVAFPMDSTKVSEISYAVFTKQKPLPARSIPLNASSPGLDYDYLEDRWFALWTYTNELPATKRGNVAKLLDVSMRSTDGPFAVRYKGFIRIPQTGVYTFYGPNEFVNNQSEPGYDLRVYIDGQQWDLGQMWHGRGMWSVALEEGLHQFQVTFADARDKDLSRQRVDLWNIPSGWGYPQPATTWRGVVPVLEVSGPAINKQSLPQQWLLRDGNQ